jgi:hypothetical protein
MSPLENTIDYRDKMSIKLCDHAQLVTLPVMTRDKID